MRRQNVNKRAGSRRFSKQAERTHPKNMRNAPMRGGWRL